MKGLEELFAKGVAGMKAYPTGTANASILLNANENPYDLPQALKEQIAARMMKISFNRYPDGQGSALREALARYVGVAPTSIALGTGSDELLHLLAELFLNPGDKVAVHRPTFSMYDHYCTLRDAQIISPEVKENLLLKMEDYIDFIQREQPKLVFLCNPNNPTGQGFSLGEIEALLQAAQGIVIVDEAYFEFSGVTAVGLLEQYENLVVLRTLSKAFGAAAIRLGYAVAREAVVEKIDTIRSPYNLSALTQVAGLVILENIEKLQQGVDQIKKERDRLVSALNALPGVEVYPTQSNFIFLRARRWRLMEQVLLEAGILVRRFSDPLLAGCLRISVGAPEENRLVMAQLQEVCNG